MTSSSSALFVAVAIIAILGYCVKLGDWVSRQRANQPAQRADQRALPPLPTQHRPASVRITAPAPALARALPPTPGWRHEGGGESALAPVHLQAHDQMIVPAPATTTIPMPLPAPVHMPMPMPIYMLPRGDSDIFGPPPPYTTSPRNDLGPAVASPPATLAAPDSHDHASAAVLESPSPAE
ncbi:hypothetical protein BC828DRAFT_408364 [Blastocladiella britannica]|nr:hypothetical protein BC828DRAFT_408364 [Blastocladiella britannica]